MLECEVRQKSWRRTSALKPVYLPIILGAALGTTAFFLMYGHEILNPEFAEWLMRGDPAQHFLGWHFFRSESWTFPPGVIRSYSFPQGTSVVYTDSLPLIAIPLKLLSPLLPKMFQYQGIWALLCYLLQGIFAAILLRRITSNLLLLAFGAIFFILSPSMYFRVIVHDSLAAHWVILAALYLYFEQDDLRNQIKWIILLSITPMIHFYLLFMVFVIWIGNLLKNLLKGFRENILSVFLFYMISVCAVFIISWLEGTFVIKVRDTATFGFGYYSMNLLSPILSIYSPATSGQYEGFNYFGFGLLLVIVISIYEISRHRGYFEFSRDFPLIVICLVLFMISLSNQITFSKYILLKISLPDFIEKALSTFRASGRMFWPVTYICIIISLAIIIKYNSLKRSIVVLMLAAGVQIVELYPLYSSFSVVSRSWKSPLRSKLWGEVAKKYHHLTIIPPQIIGDDYLPFALLAADHGMTINVGYTARTNIDERAKYEKNLLMTFTNGEIQEDSLYILKDCSFYPKNLPDTSITIRIDGYVVIAPKLKEKFTAVESQSVSQHRENHDIVFEEFLDPCHAGVAPH